MLELRKITKIYKTDDFEQKALDEVSVNFRKNEFASILGPSGSGKTTLLNIIGGLDRYDKGDLIINEVSTKKYKDRDWDTYRNHRVGFVFQTYNLISHQSVLANVELALTLSGVSKNERRKKAKEALKKVGLERHINKKPSQLSGGQMQRVAIARALVNNPDILLADEPTGALDSETSIQIMNLLKEIAKDKLVIMVTHNPEIAENYSTRIIKLKDGHIIDDSDPYDGNIDTKLDIEKEQENTKKTSMSLKTALGLSLNNLMTKKGRTFLTAFAGSIGIIGIALILSLSNGVQEYIKDIQKNALSAYPISIEESIMNMSSMFSNQGSTKSVDCKKDTICTTDDISKSPYLSMQSSITKNNVKDFKVYLENNKDKIEEYITDIEYKYDIDLQVYSKNSSGNIVKVNPNTQSMSFSSLMTATGDASVSSVSASNFLSNVFEELDTETKLKEKYDVLSGRMPTNYDEMVLVVDENNNIPLSVMYSLDIENRSELSDILSDVAKGKEINIDSITYNYDDLIGTTYKLILNSAFYQKENGIWVNKSNDTEFMNNLYNNGIELKIVGILKPNENHSDSSNGFVGYTKELSEKVISLINEEEIVKEQKSNKNINVFTGMAFDGYSSTYEDNLSILGALDLESPTTINIYPVDFESKEKVQEFIDEYNDSVDDVDKISFSDMMGTLLSGVTTIVNTISYVLIAFVAISLIVSSIMIAIITYISVLERTKEIGILRSIGASKKDITRVFNAETIIEGFIAGIFGVGITLILGIPINIIVKSMTGIAKISSLPIVSGLLLILLSIILTVIAGLIPAHKASKKDPVESLRTE